MPINPTNPHSIKFNPSARINAFDSVIATVEADVLKQCLIEDNPEHSMGPYAEPMIKNGLAFTSKLLRTMIAYGSEKIIEDQLSWCKTTLPGFGVSMTMLLNNFKRYDVAFKNKLPTIIYEEIRPYLADMIQRQNVIVKDANEKTYGE